jgi:hydroxymethylpyrimidine pyrophosphatase-like HAD family hydrolase
VRSTNIYILITLKEANKLKAIEYLQKETNEQFFFFGDSFNDLEVFEQDKIKIFTVAPKNAIKEIRQCANLSLDTTNNESLEFDYQKFLDK